MSKFLKNIKGLVDVEQGSQEWLDRRKGKITGTRAHTALVNGKGLETLIDQLVIELISHSSEESYKSAAMIRGNELEPIAREAFEVAELDFREAKTVGCIMHPTLKNFMVSPDFLFEDYGVGEIKCFEAKNYYEHWKAFKSNPSKFTFLDKKYITQVQANLACTQNDHAVGIIFNPDFYNREYIEFVIERDEKTISLLEEIIEEVDFKVNNILMNI